MVKQLTCLPRTRGDDPEWTLGDLGSLWFAPHARG